MLRLGVTSWKGLATLTLLSVRLGLGFRFATSSFCPSLPQLGQEVKLALSTLGQESCQPWLRAFAQNLGNVSCESDVQHRSN